MDVYDFDNTIYRGDSTADFILYCYLHRPKSLLSLPRTAVCGLLYVLRLMPKLTFKQNLYHMFVYIDDMESFVAQFIDSHTDHIKEWYNRQQKDDDVVISASPEFVIVPFCRKIGINTAMASRVDMHTGKYDGINCHGEEKVLRYRSVYGDTPIQEFYSDSRSDTPLAKISERAYLVKGNERKEWDL